MTSWRHIVTPCQDHDTELELNVDMAIYLQVQNIVS